MREIKENYFRDVSKPYTVTPEDFDMIIKYAMDNRELINSMLSVPYGWKTNLKCIENYIERMKTTTYNIEEKPLTEILNYIKENRLMIEVANGVMNL